MLDVIANVRCNLCLIDNSSQSSQDVSSIGRIRLNDNNDCHLFEMHIHVLEPGNASIFMRSL